MQGLIDGRADLPGREGVVAGMSSGELPMCGPLDAIFFCCRIQADEFRVAKVVNDGRYIDADVARCGRVTTNYPHHVSRGRHTAQQI